MKRVTRNVGAVLIVASAAFLGTGGAVLRSINDVIANFFYPQTRALSENQAIASGVGSLSDLQIGVQTAYAEVPSGDSGDSGDSGGSCGCGSCCC